MRCRWCGRAPASVLDDVGPLCDGDRARYEATRRQVLASLARSLGGRRVVLLNPDYDGDDPASRRFALLEVDPAEEE